MTKQLLLIICLFCYSFTNAQHTLTVIVTNLENNVGLVSVALLDANEKVIKGKTNAIKNKQCIVTFDSLKVSSYAIQYFHDENMNKEMDTNFIGIPKEGFGFSNDAMGKYGPKDFEEWLVTVNKDTEITLITTYY